MKKLALLAFLFAGAGAMAVVIYDNGAVDGVNGLSNFAGNLSGTAYDREIADDFVLTAPNLTITDVHFTGIWYAGTTNAPPGGVRARIYANTGANQPAQTPLYDQTFSVTATPTGASYFSRPEVAFDGNLNTPVTLTGGTSYYVSLQPQATTDNFYQLTTGTHGASPVWLYYSPDGYPKWTTGATVFGSAYDVNFKLTGVPEPASLLLIGLAGLVLRRR